MIVLIRKGHVLIVLTTFVDTINKHRHNKLQVVYCAS